MSDHEIGMSPDIDKARSDCEHGSTTNVGSHASRCNDCKMMFSYCHGCSSEAGAVYHEPPTCAPCPTHGNKDCTGVPSCVWYGCPNDGALKIIMPDGAIEGICRGHNDALAAILRPRPKAKHRLVNAEERSHNFNDTTGALTWNGRSGNEHPDRCVCQEEEKGGPYAGTPHKHYDEPPYACARCMCAGYRPQQAPSENR